MSVTAYRLGLRGQFRDTALEGSLGACGIPVLRVFAPDLSSVSEERLRILYSDRASRAISGHGLARSEVSCTLGHRRMLRHFRASGSDWGLFFEDDAEPTDRLSELALTLPEGDTEPVFLHLFPVHAQSSARGILWHGHEMRERVFPEIMSCGYAMNRAAALALLKATKSRRVATPADWEPWWLGQCRFLEVAEPVVRHPPQGVGSIISIDRAPATARPTTRALRRLPQGPWIESRMRRAGVFALARWIQGAPFRRVYLRDRGEI